MGSCSDVSEITKAPEILGGRVKTLHPSVHGGNAPLSPIEGLKLTGDQEFWPETLTLIKRIWMPLGS
jgi:hypothetical protein